MLHHFDPEAAARYGILEAVLINHLQFWIEQNRKNGANLIDGCCWTYQSVRQLREQLPYATDKQIRSALKRLVDAGVLRTGQYNKKAYDRTLWYTLTEFGQSIAPIGKIDVPDLSDRIDKTAKPIPDDTTDDTADNAADDTAERKRTGRRFVPPTAQEVKEYCRQRNNSVDAERFVDYYTANGWRVGKNPMKDWKAAVRTWERGGKTAGPAADLTGDALYDIFCKGEK